MKKNLFHGLVIMLTLCALAMSAGAQPRPVITDCCGQAAALQKQIYALQDEVVRIKLDYKKLGDTGTRLLQAKEARIAELTAQANVKLGLSNALAKKAEGKLETLRTELDKELIQSRFLGWGRKRWVKRTLKLLLE